MYEPNLSFSMWRPSHTCGGAGFGRTRWDSTHWPSSQVEERGEGFPPLRHSFLGAIANT